MKSSDICNCQHGNTTWRAIAKLTIELHTFKFYSVRNVHAELAQVMLHLQPQKQGNKFGH